VTAVAFEAERWFADKGRRVARVETLDALESLEIARVTFADGGEALYSLVPDDMDWASVLPRADGAFAFDGAAPKGPSRRLNVDQSHTSWRAGGALVKCYRRLAPGVHPEVELLEALTAHGFPSSPRYLGTLAWRDVAVAVVEEFVEGEDGWEWCAARACAGDASFAEAVGGLTRQLHDALAGSFPTGVATADVTLRWHREAEAQLGRASLRSDAARATRELARLAEGRGTAVTRVHGDLHVGQLVFGERIVIVDFEGQPTKSTVERRALDTPLRDLASLSRSLDHCGRYAVERHGADAAATERWIAEARGLLLAAYGDHDEALLRALEWERAVYEFTYAADYLPEWLYAPRGGLAALAREPE
jgi:predicted trehalose synthase